VAIRRTWFVPLLGWFPRRTVFKNGRDELWDVEAGDLVGSFADLVAGLGVTVALLHADGDRYADDLELTERDDAGNVHRRAAGRQPRMMVAERRVRVSAP